MRSFVATWLGLMLAVLSVSSVPSVPSAAYAVDDVVTADSIVDLTLRKNLCIGVSLHQPLRNQTSEQFLLSINGEDLSKSSFDQIKKKLAGPAGSQVKIEIGYPSGETQTFDITRAVPNDQKERRTSDPIQDLGNRFENLSSGYGTANLIENSLFNSDLFARASCVRASEAIRGNSRNEASVFMNCMLLSLSVGDFDGADKYLALAINSMKTNPADVNTTYREKAAIEDLILLGKYSDAEFICQYLLQPVPNHGARLPQPITLLGTYSLIPTKSAQEACKKLAQQIFSGQVAQATAFPADNYWLAQYLESMGMNDKALDLYAATLKKIREYTPGYYGTQQIVFGLYSKARLEAQLGKTDDARKDLEAITDSYKLLSAKQQQLLNRIPEFFPTAADVDTALASLKKSGNIPPAPAAAGYSNQDPYTLIGSTSAFKNSFQNAKQCFSSIRANKRAEASALADQLIKAYRDVEPTRPYAPVRQNLFSTSLYFARLMADRGWFDEADKLLKSLEAAARDKVPAIPAGDIGWVMLDAEKIYVAAKVGGGVPAASVWQTLNPGVRAPNGLSLADRLSLLAQAYSVAQEPQRAKFFIDRAVKTVDTSDGVYGTNAAQKQALIYMTAASIYAKQSDFHNAENYSKLAFSSVRRNDLKLAILSIDTADALSRRGRTGEAIAVLESASKLEPERAMQPYEVIFGRTLAKLYDKNGQLDKAVSIIGAMISAQKQYASAEDYLLAAQLSEKAKDYRNAAKFYYEAGQRNRGGATEEQRESALRKSIACAGLVKDFDQSILARAYRDLSNLAVRRSQGERLTLLEKSLSLMPDSDPEKPKELSNLSYLRSEVSRSKLQPTSAVTPAPAPANDTSAFQSRRAPLEQAAELASKNNAKEAGALWLRLALMDAEAKDIDAAVADARKAIATYQPANVKTHVRSELVDENLPTALAKAGSPDKAEMILNEAQKQVDTVAGAGSLPSQVQMSHNFRYLFSQQKYAQADVVLDELLKTDLNQGQYAPPNHSITHCVFGGGPFPVESSWGVINDLMSLPSVPGDAENRHQLHVLNKILEAEKKQFGNKDYRVGLTFARIARIYAAADQNDEAYKNFMAALNVMHQNEGMMFVLSNLYPDFHSVMQKLHKQSELEKLEETSRAEQKALRGG